MGRPEGPGCYCFVNSILRSVLDGLTDKYDYVIIDTEAGMEHLSRRTTRGINYMFIVSDITPQGIMTAYRIKNLASELKLDIQNTILVLNRTNQCTDKLISLISKCGFQKFETIPECAEIVERSVDAKPLLDIPFECNAYQAVRKIVCNNILEKDGR
jgi:CO dehydrogenase maturation factor